MRRAASASWETARMALPRRVFCTMNWRAIMSATETPMMINDLAEMTTPPTTNWALK